MTRSWGKPSEQQRTPASDLPRFIVPLSASPDASRNVPSTIGYTLTLYAEPQLRVVLGAPAYDRRLSVWSGLACTSLQIGRNEQFACAGWVRVHDALRLARGHTVEPGAIVQLRLVNIGGGAYTIPPLGWYAVAP